MLLLTPAYRGGRSEQSEDLVKASTPTLYRQPNKLRNGAHLDDARAQCSLLVTPVPAETLRHDQLPSGVPAIGA